LNYDYDIVIIGAGPAGTTCALMLAHTGLKIAVIDKAVFPRDKICGDALSGNVMNTLKRLPGNIFDKFTNDFIDKLPSLGIKFIAPNLNSIDIPFSGTDVACNVSNHNPPGYISKRIDFDNFLFQQLRNYSNISVFENCRIENILYSGNSVIAESSDKSFTSRIIIGADGANSIVAKNRNPKPETQNLKHETRNSEHCIGLRAYYKNVTFPNPPNNDNFIELYFLKDILPGYFWLFPLPDNTANVGIGMLSDHVRKKKINIKSTMLSIIESHTLISPRFKDAVQTDEFKAFPLPLCTGRMPASGERFLLLGDAASLIDPFTGEGIGNAMLSGRIAAEHITECFRSNDFSAPMLYNYDIKLYNKIRKEINISRIMQKLSYHPFLFNLVVNKASKNKTLHDTIIKMINNIDVKKQLTQPSFYFNLLFK
jgi:menaquinone-9 beta-reductase